MRRRAALLLIVGGCVAPTAPVPPTPPPPPALVAAPAPVDVRIEGRLEQGGVAFGTVSPGVRGLRIGDAPVPVATDGRFMLGFDRDAPPVLELRAEGYARSLAIAPRAWAIERVNVAKRPGVTDAEYEKLRAPEVARITAARATVSASEGWRQRFMWPARGRISGVFGSQRLYKGGEAGAYHSGVDVAGGAGAAVVAPADGVVVLAAATPFTLEGRLLILDHGMGLNSAFLHLSRIDVREGDRVRQGQTVGAIGASGRTTGPHLHWAVKWGAARVDPVGLIGAE